MRRALAVIFVVAAFVGGTAGVADAMRPPPQCIRECDPWPRLPELPDPGPCHGLTDGFC